MKTVEYVEARTVQEAVAFLVEHGLEARALAGGTDLLVQMREHGRAPNYLVNLGTIPDLDYINEDKDGLHIGALTPIRALETAPLVRERFGILTQAARLLGCVQVRNLATLGGNLCHAAPSAEMAPPLLALEATVRIAGPGGERVIPLAELFVGPGETTLQPGEVLTEVQVPAPRPRSAGVYLKHSVRQAMDIAFVGTAVVVELGEGDGVCRDIRIALGAVAPTPMRAPATEAVLRGQKLAEPLLREAGERAAQECRPISDVRCSAEHRRAIVAVFVERATQQAFELAGGR